MRYEVIAWDGFSIFRTYDQPTRRLARMQRRDLQGLGKLKWFRRRLYIDGNPMKQRYTYYSFAKFFAKVKIWDRKRKEFIH